MRETVFTCACGYEQIHKPGSRSVVAIPACVCGRMMRIAKIRTVESTPFEIMLGSAVAVFALYGFTDIIWRIL